MKKVIHPSQMTSIESKAYQNGYSDEAFMESAGQGIAQRVVSFVKDKELGKNILLLCGKGNNGGDAFVAGRYLLNYGFTVTALQIDSPDQCSSLCKKNRERLLAQGGTVVDHLIPMDQFFLILDGLFGTGFKGKIEEPYASLIHGANTSQLPILAIDIPSGLNGSTGEVCSISIEATETIYLGLPKTGFFLRNGWNAVGDLFEVDFGLPNDLIDSIACDFLLPSPTDIKIFFPRRVRNRDKYQAGYVVGLAGSREFPGAALLSSLAAFRSGAGIVRLFHPQGMDSLLASAPYELIKTPYDSGDIDTMVQAMNKAGAVFIGPGMGRTDETSRVLHQITKRINVPCVFDADALFHYAQKPFTLPTHTIFTPHHGEMQKLLHQETAFSLDSDMLSRCQRYAEEHNITLVLKGAPTFIFHPQSSPVVNPTGNPGMATAGSGDVLTGVIAALLAEKLSCPEAAIAGVYLHGVAGNLAAKSRGTSLGMMASDIIQQLPSSIDLK